MPGRHHRPPVGGAPHELGGLSCVGPVAVSRYRASASRKKPRRSPQEPGWSDSETSIDVRRWRCRRAAARPTAAPPRTTTTSGGLSGLVGVHRHHYVQVRILKVADRPDDARAV